MFFALLHQYDAVTVCYPQQNYDFWHRWSVVLSQRIKSGLLLSNHLLFLQDVKNLERWILGNISLVHRENQGFTFVPFLKDQHKERWSLIFTDDWQLLLVSSDQESQALFSFAPPAIQLMLDTLFESVSEHRLKERLKSFPLKMPDYQDMAGLMGGFLSVIHPVEVIIPQLEEMDVLQSMIHEVRTPLTTIRTLIHSLLRRSDLSNLVCQRLEQIDREATAQIDRLNLIFQIVEQARPLSKESLSLEDMLVKLLPSWQWQTERRSLSLEYHPFAGELPPILSNSELLQQLLNGLIDRLFRLLPPKSKIELGTYWVGNFVKLEIITSGSGFHPLRPIGRWLLFQPETGVISLSLVVTKALFQSLGGKFTLKTIPNGEVLTVFLPVLPG